MDATTDRDALIAGHMGLVKFIGAKYANRHDRDDVFQVGYVGLVKAADAFDGSIGVPFHTYAGNGIRNEIFSYLRKVRRWRRCLVVGGNDECQPLADVADYRACRAAEASLAADVVREALADLHPAKRRIMSLRWIDGYSVRETSQILGVTEGHVINHACRAKPHVRNRVKEILGIERE